MCQHEAGRWWGGRQKESVPTAASVEKVVRGAMSNRGGGEGQEEGGGMATNEQKNKKTFMDPRTEPRGGKRENCNHV